MTRWWCLLATGAAVVCSATSPEWRDTEATTLVWRVVSSHNNDVLKKMLTDDPSLLHTRSADGRGALFWAYEYSNFEAVRLLRTMGADEKMRDKDNKLPTEMPRGSVRHDTGFTGAGMEQSAESFTRPPTPPPSSYQKPYDSDDYRASRTYDDDDDL